VKLLKVSSREALNTSILQSGGFPRSLSYAEISQQPICATIPNVSLKKLGLNHHTSSIISYQINHIQHIDILLKISYPGNIIQFVV
jgi:hypothetical protein